MGLGDDWWEAPLSSARSASFCFFHDGLQQSSTRTLYTIISAAHLQGNCQLSELAPFVNTLSFLSFLPCLKNHHPFCRAGPPTTWELSEAHAPPTPSLVAREDPPSFLDMPVRRIFCRSTPVPSLLCSHEIRATSHTAVEKLMHTTAAEGGGGGCSGKPWHSALFATRNM